MWNIEESKVLENFPPWILSRQGPSGQPKDNWIETETKRRTFWLAYKIDRFASMVDGLHLFFNGQMVLKEGVINHQGQQNLKPKEKEKAFTYLIAPAHETMKKGK